MGVLSLVLLAPALLALVSCGKARTDVTGKERCVTWQEEIAPQFTERCQGCHTGAAAGGGYRTTSYAEVLGGGSDATPDAIAGDESSVLLRVLDPLTADATHGPVTDLAPLVRRWVVDCNLSFVTSSIHRAGILDPTSADFHGRLLREQKYDFGVCQRCHGTDFAGGTSKVSCLTCHAEGPTACSTCHGAIEKSGSHGHHLGLGPLAKKFDCAECHRVPATYKDVGHIFLADGSLDPPPAEVRLGATAALTPQGSTPPAPPAWDPATQSCTNVYCHGARLPDSGATHTAPVWSAPGTGQADCGSCHGLPPNHATADVKNDTCAACHPSVVDRSRLIIAPDKHIDGKVDFGDPALACNGCHGTAASPAPPPDLEGDMTSSARGVGAHAAHRLAPAGLRGPIACNECHLVPAEIGSTGHFAGHAAGADLTPGAEVFPADPSVGVTAALAGAQPHYDTATATCSGVYCHGAGTTLAHDTAAGVDRAPVWTGGGMTCGVSCHGLPPVFSPHVPTMTRTDCASCHPRTIDPAGVLILSGPPGAETSRHMNGVVDLAL